MTRADLFEAIVVPAIWLTKRNERKWVRFLGQFVAVVPMFPWAFPSMLVMLSIFLMLSWWDNA